MSSSYPPQPPRKLERSKSNRVLGGVCAGVATYLNMDPTLVRVLTVVISLFTGVPVILYIIALFVIPEEGSQPATPTYPPVGGPQGQAAGYSAPPQATGYSTAPPQAAQPAYTPPPQASQQPAPAASAEDSVWGTEGPPWEQRQSSSEAPAESQPEPTGPSEPEAPVAPAAHEEDATESALEPEGPEERPAENPQTEPRAGAESESEGGQQTDKS